MKIALLVLACSLAAVGCSSNDSCTNAAHAACDLDGGVGCGSHQTCVDESSAVDPCPSGAAGCCFTVCSADADCGSGQLCIGGACATGACVTTPDAGS